MDDSFFDQNTAKSPAIPRFYSEPVKNNFKSEQAGRPIHEDREFVSVVIPGDRRSQPVYEVTDEHRERWAKAYAAFKAGQEAPLEGTPLADWPPISRSLAADLAALHIKTVEQLAEVSDAHLQNLGMGARELREKARKFLEVARTGTGPLERMVERQADLELENADLKRQLGELGARLEAMETANVRAAA